MKSARTGKIQLSDAFVDFQSGEAYLVGAHISPYSHGNRENHLPDRPRKLLLSRREIDKLAGRVVTKGYSVVPLQVYLRGSRIKVEIGLVQGKKLYDKRADRTHQRARPRSRHRHGPRHPRPRRPLVGCRSRQQKTSTSLGT